MLDNELIKRNEEWIKSAFREINRHDKIIASIKKDIEELKKENRELKGRC